MDVAASLVEPRGLEWDRRFMVVDERGGFLTIRNIPKMATVSATVDEERLVLAQEALGSVCIPLEATGSVIRVRVWRKWVGGIVVSPDADRFVSAALGRECRLVRMPPSSKRRVAEPFNAGGDVVSYADAMPILVASEASQEDLNGRMAEPIPIDRFRPNVVLSGCGPFEEDTWSRLRIGDVVLRATKKCNRCQVTTTEQLTGELKGPEPLKTLATYRRNGNGVAFGMYYVPERLGKVSVGQECQAQI